MDYQLLVITLAVSDVEAAAAFYIRQAGFTLDVDYHPASGFRVVQLTPPGSPCSVQIGVGLTDAPPGSARSTYLAVTISKLPAESSGDGALRSAASGTRCRRMTGKAAGSPVPTRNAATTPASPTSLTRTATPG
jgi:hypothetical protein